MLDILIGRGRNGPDSDEKVGLGSIRRPVIGLALGGGAARGFAHIGILKALIAHGIVPNVVVKPTIAGIRARRDEVLEEALRQILGGQATDAAIQKMAKP